MSKPHIVAISLVALAAASPAAPPAVAPAPHAVTCSSPVGPRDSARALQRRFGKQARIETIAGAEGETTRAVVLYPRDPRRRLEVVFFDEALRQPSSISVTGRQSDWTFDGFRLGDGIDRFTAANGKPFELAGFEWDYGGIVHNWGGKGALEAHDVQCGLSARFAPSVRQLPEALVGDVVLKSNQPQLRRVRPVAVELSMNWHGGQ